MRAAKAFITVVVLAVGLPAAAVIICHDYTHWRALGSDPTPPIPGKPPEATGNGMSAQGLRDALQAKGYKPFDITTTARDNPAETQRHLRPGDVIILGNSHSGYVADAKGRIDHWLQISGQSGRYRVAADLEKEELKGTPGHGGLFKAQTLKEFLEAPSRPNPSEHVVIWRRVK